jgi:protein-S-isoprenylcysteine O-methyltransferase Ste14
LHPASGMDQARRSGVTGRGAALRAAAAVGAFALVHSALASRSAKRAAERIAGERGRDGWYRAAYNAQAVATFAALVAYVGRLPDRRLYDARGVLAGLLRAGQLAGLAYAAAALREVGLGPFAGATSLAAWAGARPQVPREPEGQGPAPAPQGGGLRTTGPFAWSRHPLNFAPLPVLWLNPHMTVNLAVFNAATTLYLIAGSRHEEARLAAAYGADYEAYRRSGVPFYWPRVRLGVRPSGADAAGVAAAPAG